MTRRWMAITAGSRPGQPPSFTTSPGCRNVTPQLARPACSGGCRVRAGDRFYITSLVLLATSLAPIVRSHWVIENSLNWVMDMVFRDDKCRLRTDEFLACLVTR